MRGSVPFITFYTPTYRRPHGLARCLASVAGQTAIHDIEQIVIPDHVRVGIDGMYANIPRYIDAVHGDYVHLLADDDELAGPTVVEQVRDFAVAHQFPPVILVAVNKGGLELPIGSPWPPVMGHIDLGCVITRADVWKAHAKDYGRRYEGDFDFAAALYQAGHSAEWCDLLFLTGGVSRGAAEAAA